MTGKSVKAAGAGKEDVPANDFRAWLERLIDESGGELNQAGGTIHVTGKRIFLVTPRIFELYAGAHSTDPDTAQRNFRSLGIHLKNPGQRKQEWWEAKLIGKKGTLTVVKGWIIPMEHLNVQANLTLNGDLTLMGDRTGHAGRTT